MIIICPVASEETADVQILVNLKDIALPNPALNIWTLFVLSFNKRLVTVL